MLLDEYVGELNEENWKVYSVMSAHFKATSGGNAESWAGSLYSDPLLLLQAQNKSTGKVIPKEIITEKIPATHLSMPL
ncbi:MAG: hypothetical protein ACHQEM_01745 [Chitinophagales bacterium]